MGFFAKLLGMEPAAFEYGWDGKCKGCGQWHHQSQQAICVCATADSWIYLCSCGTFTRWFLHAPVPIREDSDNG
jgi:hypothetical protein